jgi:hypothetical protein
MPVPAERSDARTGASGEWAASQTMARSAYSAVWDSTIGDALTLSPSSRRTPWHLPFGESRRIA